jgi:hypothetical protein
MYLVILIILPIILILLPATFFDEGESICFSVLFLNSECYACGMTRAIQHLIHLDFNESWYFNRLSIIVLPLLIISYIKEFRRVYILVS